MNHVSSVKLAASQILIVMKSYSLHPCENFFIWNSLLPGKMHQAELKERLRGTPLEIEIHDRDHVAVKRSTKAKLFGDELEDEKISNVGAVSSESDF